MAKEHSKGTARFANADPRPVFDPIAPSPNCYIQGSPTRLKTHIISVLEANRNLCKKVRDLDHARASGDSVVRDGGVAASQNDVALAADGCCALRCLWDGKGVASFNSRGSVTSMSNLSQLEPLDRRLTERRQVL